MKTKSRCCLVTIASTDHCEITRCDECGNIQMHIGPIAMRIPTYVFDDVVNCMNIAWAHIQKTVCIENQNKKSLVQVSKH